MEKPIILMPVVTGQYRRLQESVITRTPSGREVTPKVIYDLTQVVRDRARLVRECHIQHGEVILLVFASDPDQREWYVEVVKRQGPSTFHTALASLGQLYWREDREWSIKRLVGFSTHEFCELIRNLHPLKNVIQLPNTSLTSCGIALPPRPKVAL